MTTIPILSFVAYSGTGKTTLLLKIIPLLKAKGLRIGMIKHTHHQKFDVDHPGKDSYRLRHAGAEQMLVASRSRWALMVDIGEKYDEPPLEQLLPHLDQDKLDLILVEGFKHEPFPKIEVHRPSLEQGFFFPDDETVIAIASDEPLEITTDLPVLDMNQPAQIVAFIEERFLRHSS
ncbi:MAG: molybdopterin-guanine dinucleotide biosynthesis protein B [Gammaproteobacteria bacterium]|nr:MAG: molybdopterin-guanine dinucleotide biosynthesis protein B [Gammaproteobacteria bacterium]RKZ43908.1 MAG: molybdopterin-guanine dinucleotide biosynthesis protein B [Gammaproteobacteria bacterium]RKZ75675.1 MAG: molybdopterin-guanine dinucleotide biosynthesis protein B [Gammaproteobacteria bacterium]